MTHSFLLLDERFEWVFIAVLSVAFSVFVHESRLTRILVCSTLLRWLSSLPLGRCASRPVQDIVHPDLEQPRDGHYAELRSLSRYVSKNETANPPNCGTSSSYRTRFSSFSVLTRNTTLAPCLSFVCLEQEPICAPSHMTLDGFWTAFI